MKKEIEKLLMASKENIDATKEELNNFKRNNACVVIYKNHEINDMFYGITKSEINQISNTIKNVIPMPSINTIKVMNYGSAENEIYNLPCIVNGSGTRFSGKIIPYVMYLSMYLEIIEKNYNFLVKHLDI